MLAIVTGVSSFFFIAMFGMLQFREVQQNRVAVRAIAESNQRQHLITDYLAMLQDIETGQRGFVVTGNPEFLQPQQDAQRRAGTLERRLAAAFPVAGGASRTAAELVRVGRAKQAYAQRVIALNRTQGERAASAVIAGGDGKRIMDRARLLVGKLERAEEGHARALLLDAADDRQQRQRNIILAELALVISLAGLLYAMFQSNRAWRRSSNALSDAATRQAAIFEAANDAMMILDAEGTVTSVNSAAERLFGRGREDIIGRSNLALFANPPSREVSRAYLDGIAAGDNRFKPIQIFVGARADGSSFETEVATTPVTLHGGRHFLGVARDTTERRRIEQLKNEFVATVSHELRTPLTSIAGSLGLLMGGAAGELPGKAARLLGIAHANSQRLIRLINDILDIEKIEAGKAFFSPQTLDLAAVLRDAIHDSSGLAAQRGVTLRLAPVASGSSIHADPDRIAQVLANLLSNAIKYSPEGGVVTVSTERQNLIQRISIADQGRGIPDAFRDRIFQKFAQADSSDTRSLGGTGLGLSIVREIIVQSGGSVSFDSASGAGTVFHVDLPAQTIVSREAIDSAALVPQSEMAARHLLHVDDDPDTLRVVAAAFDGRFAVHSTPSVHEGEAALRRFRYDIVILDLAMSDGSGLDLVPAARASSDRCPIIIYTAYDVDAATAGKADGVCIKSRDPLETLVTLADRLAGPQRTPA